MTPKISKSKFKNNDDGTIQIRREVINKKAIVFGVANTDLSVIQSDIDFDKKSDDIIEKYK